MSTVRETVEDGNGHVISQTVDHGDGTGTRTTYTPEGEVESVEELSGLPIPTEPTLDPYVAYAVAVEAAQTLQEVRAAGAALRQALEAS